MPAAAGQPSWPLRLGYSSALARAVAGEILTAQIETIIAANRRVHGVPRIHAELTEAGVHVGRKRVARLMRQPEIVGCRRRKRSSAITKQNPAADRPGSSDSSSPRRGTSCGLPT